MTVEDIVDEELIMANKPKEVEAAAKPADVEPIISIPAGKTN